MIIRASEVKAIGLVMRELAKTCTEIADEIDKWNDPSAETAEKTVDRIKRAVAKFVVTLEPLASLTKQ